MAGGGARVQQQPRVADRASRRSGGGGPSATSACGRTHAARVGRYGPFLLGQQASSSGLRLTAATRGSWAAVRQAGQTKDSGLQAAAAHGLASRGDASRELAWPHAGGNFGPQQQGEGDWLQLILMSCPFHGTGCNVSSFI